MHLKSSSASERHFGPLGAVLGSILGSFWGRLGLCFAARRPNTKTLIFDDPVERNHVSSSPWRSKNQSKISPESLLALELAPRASWRPLGLDFWILWGSQNGPKRSLESKLKFEAFLSDFGSREPKGRRHEVGPSGRGLLGSLPTVDAGLLRSCACHSAFGTSKSLRSRPQVSLKAQWPDLQWACGPKPTTEPAVLCASVPQRSQRILWEVISNSVFDRVVGRAQASKKDA